MIEESKSNPMKILLKDRVAKVNIDSKSIRAEKEREHMFDNHDACRMHTLVLVLALFNEKIDSLIYSLSQRRWLATDTSFRLIDSALCPFISHPPSQAKTQERIERQELISTLFESSLFFKHTLIKEPELNIHEMFIDHRIDKTKD